MSRRTSSDASSSAWPGARSALQVDRDTDGSSRGDRVGPKPRSSRAMLSIAHRLPLDVDGTVSLPIVADVAALALEHANLHRVLLAALAVGRRSRRRRPPSAAASLPIVDMRTPRSAARADRRRRAPRGWRCCSRSSRRPGSASPCAFASELLRVVVQLSSVGPEQAGLDREVAAAAAERVPADDAPASAPGCRARTWRTCVMTSSCVTFRSSTGSR